MSDFMERFVKMERLNPIPDIWNKPNCSAFEKRRMCFYEVYDHMVSLGKTNFKIIPLEHYWIVEEGTQ